MQKNNTFNTHASHTKNEKELFLSLRRWQLGKEDEYYAAESLKETDILKYMSKPFW